MVKEDDNIHTLGINRKIELGTMGETLKVGEFTYNEYCSGLQL